MKLCIDAGHGVGNITPGKYDPGAVSKVEEADITLAWALTGKWVMRKAGISVWLTRERDDDEAPLATRDERAEAEGCTHLISIHCNASMNFNARGAESFYRSTHNKQFAAMAARAAAEALDIEVRGVKHESNSQHERLSILGFKGVCALLELGFITNMLERGRMQERSRRIKFWELIAADLKEANE